MGLGMPTPLPPPGAGTTTIMTTMSAMAGNMTSSSMRSGMSSVPQCRQPPAYKVAQQMARLHRLGRANSHEGVTYRGTDHEDGTSQIALPFTHGSHSLSYTRLFDLRSLRRFFLRSRCQRSRTARSFDLLTKALCQFTTVRIAFVKTVPLTTINLRDIFIDFCRLIFFIMLLKMTLLS